MRPASRLVIEQCSEEECVTSEMEIHKQGAMSEAAAPKRIPRRVSSCGGMNTYLISFALSCIIFEIIFILTYIIAVII